MGYQYSNTVKKNSKSPPINYFANRATDTLKDSRGDAKIRAPIEVVSITFER